METNKPIEGLKFVTDANNNRVAAIIHLNAINKDLWEDIYDYITAHSRVQEATIPLEEVKEGLEEEE